MSGFGADKHGTPRGSGVCSRCGGLGVLRDKPWKPMRETMTCPHCFDPQAERDPDCLLPFPDKAEGKP